jgi:MFS family permease
MTEPTPLTARQARRRYFTLVGLRWLPAGLLMPVFVLLPLSRGLSLTEIGVVFALQGLVVLALELPTGGLSDALGRRPVLVFASVIALLSLSLFAIADSVPVFAVAVVLQGVFRALDSGPLEAWFVDATLVAEPGAPIEHGLARGSTVLGLAIALGALASGALTAVRPVPVMEPLLVPILVALAIAVANVVAIVVLMAEPARARHPRAVVASVRAVPGVIRDGVGLLRSSVVLRALVAVELFWGFSMVAFESLVPVRMAELTGGTDAAAAVMGPVSAAAWLAAAGGAAGIALVSGRIGVARTAAALRVAQGATVVAMGLLAGAAGVVIAFLACYATHGASNPMHTTLLHRQVDEGHRTTILSLNSMVAQPAAAIGMIVLAALADGTSVATAMIVGGIVCALAAPLYLPARRAEVAAGEPRLEAAAA